MAQVMTRLKLNIFGNEAPSQEYKVTFSRMIMIVIAYWILASIFSPPSPEFEADNHGNVTVTRDDCPIWQRIIYNLVTASFTLYTLIVLIKVRAAVRKRYQIPEKQCHGMEDCCCAFWCGCCTVAQLARQTADYDQRRAVCCSETGLPSLSPAIIV
jgi:Cys-rich protein (TIGR01571 family)